MDRYLDNVGTNWNDCIMEIRLVSTPCKHNKHTYNTVNIGSKHTDISIG
jgi:hypothetical protein